MLNCDMNQAKNGLPKNWGTFWILDLDIHIVHGAVQWTLRIVRKRVDCIPTEIFTCSWWYVFFCSYHLMNSPQSYDSLRFVLNSDGGGIVNIAIKYSGYWLVIDTPYLSSYF